MNELPDDPDFDAPDREDEPSDADTNLILDYLSNKLDPKDAKRLEDRGHLHGATLHQNKATTSSLLGVADMGSPRRTIWRRFTASPT